MPNSNDEWAKYKVKPTSTEEWEKYKVSPAETPTESKATISARPKGVLSWLQDLEADVLRGTGTTAPGRLLRGMGAPGIETGVSKEAGEFMGSPILGAIHAAQGLTMFPSHPWEGTKTTASGVLESLTIPGLIEAGPEEGGSKLLARGEELLKARRAAKVAEKSTEKLGKINELLGVTSGELRTGKAPETVQKFVTNPARGIVKSGLDEKALAKMTPIERNQVVVAARDAAGQELGAAFKKASDAGMIVNLKDTVDSVFKEIPDRKLMQQTRVRLTQIVNRALGKPNIPEEVPVSWSQLMRELSGVSPSQAHAIRMGLDDFADFAPEGATKTFANVATSLRRGIAAKIRELLPDTKELDQHYSDLAGAAKATEKKLKQFARKGPEPSLLRKIARGAKREIVERPIRTTAYALGVPYVGHEIVKHYSAVPGER